jgi:hypothetical protein
MGGFKKIANCLEKCLDRGRRYVYPVRLPGLGAGQIFLEEFFDN